MSARDRILSRIRRATAQGRDEAERREGVRARLAAAGRQTAPTPAGARTPPEAHLAQFEDKLRAVDATVSHVPRLADLPAALAHELRARNLPPSLRMGEEPAFAALDWAGLEVSRGPGRLEEPAALSRAWFGVAETGTLALLSGPDNPVTLTFLAETHFVALRRADILPGLDELWAALRASGRDARTVNLVTGPSRSADIGQVLQLGAHGPVALHVFVIDD
ncbi:LutC/YkgG family protein [Oceanicella actignis]|uniref:L-lactate dehydrogenase complex protein LldG/L-lactate dehydrogenase complex protein LldF n=1 Tax=Oceanicella actignis TaxID=1189325 RepID=A0A1M7TSM1_9RHOB|nr:lactate utilization protein [Oceanicella actignis]SET76918.1 L-lactate dehydrogenase complex protein LldG [Oceanicella actignis]SHN73613.1 L-lactate dehydrogenase complex protein LldG/L-lactate dehydrogenase complex protein LldF [Oceanicella actignis]